MGRPAPAQEPLAHRRPPRGDRRRAGRQPLSFVDETGFSVGWVEPDPAWMARAAHAVALDGKVWVVDPFDFPGAEERVRALGEPAGVVQAFGRHARDGAAWATRLGVPLHVVPRELPGSGWQVIPIPGVPGWKEIALWDPSERVLVCMEALAAAPGYSAPGERVGVHPFLRVARPPRALADLPVEHLLLGHGEGVHGLEARQAIANALDGARTGTPGFLLGQARRLLARS